MRKVHGLRGELKVQVRTAFVEDALRAKVIFIQHQGKALPYFVESIRESNELLLKLEGVNTPEAARALQGSELWLRRAEVLGDPEEPEEDAPLEALVGYSVFEVEKGLIGEIIEIIEMPQQLMAVVAYQDREVMIPLNDQFLRKVNHRQKKLQMELPEGLLEL